MADEVLSENVKRCKNCGNPARPTRLVGRPPDHCSDKCRDRGYRQRARPDKSDWPRCSIDLCSHTVRQPKSTLCNRHYAIERKAKAGHCKIHKCNRPAVRVGHGLCETHYYRLRRNGNFDGPVVAGRYELKSGYRKLLLADHPLAEKSQGQVYEHRYVAYEARNGVCTPCHWCGCDLTWTTATIDHLNENKLDNEPQNLVTACSKCNRARGQFKDFLLRATDQGFEAFVQTSRDFRSTSRNR